MRSDDEQLESLKHWWSKNAKAVILGSTLALVSVGGWKFWESHQLSKVEVASQLYGELSQLIEQNSSEAQQQVQYLIQRLTSEHKGSVYADYANLFAARLAVESDQLAQAKIHLEDVLANSDFDAIQLVARLRLARILNSEENYASALTLLDVKDSGGFTAEFQALKGDLLMQQGKVNQAREAYQRSIDASRAVGETTPLVEMKLDSIAGQDDA